MKGDILDYPKCYRCDRRGDRYDVKKGYASSINYGTRKVKKEFICSNNHVWHEEEIWELKWPTSADL